MENKCKLLIDTDIGDDMDDAVALLAAMAAGFHIVGVTTVFRDTRSRARMAKKLLSEFGRGYESVPVYPGLPVWSPGAENRQHMGSFSPDLDQWEPDRGDAVDFILDSCRRWGKELTVIGLGPFCNLAEALRRDPEALNLAGRVVIMGGAYFRQYADWNVMCDPAAADALFRGVSRLECIGADVTHLLEPDEGLRTQLVYPDAPDRALAFVSEMCRTWLRDNPREPFRMHDVLVIYHLLDPALCHMESVRAAVITEGLAKGLTLNVDGYGKADLNPAYAGMDPLPRVLVACRVDTERFFRYLQRDISLCTLTRNS